MKKSVVFLIIGLTLPLIVSIFALGSGMGMVKKALEESEGNVGGTGPDGAIPGTAGPDPSSVATFEELRSETLSVADELSVKVEGGQIDVTFNPTLKGEAKLVVRGSPDAKPEVLASPEALSFAPRRPTDPGDGEGRAGSAAPEPDSNTNGSDGTIGPNNANGESGFIVTLELPAEFIALTFDVRAGRCSLTGDGRTSFKSLALTFGASKCDASFEGLEAQAMEVTTQASELSLSAKTMTVAALEVAQDAGSVDLDIEGLTFRAPGVPGRAALSVNAGKGDFSFGGLGSYELSASVNAGKLSLVEGREETELAGPSQDRTVRRGIGGPKIEARLNAGRMFLAFPDAAQAL